MDKSNKQMIKLVLDDGSVSWYYVEYGDMYNVMIKYYDDGSNNFVKKWYKNDDIHRDGDLPAIEHYYFKEWWKNGLRHRDGDLPAVEFNNKEHKEWWYKGMLHRDFGPAKICSYNFLNYYKEVWYYYGEIHCLRGPAIVSKLCNRVSEYYYIDGKKYMRDKYNKIIKLIRRFVEMINYRRRIRFYNKINKVGMNEIVLKKICFYSI